MLKHESVRALDRFASQVEAAFEDNLVSLVVFGEAASNRSTAPDSPVEVMIVLRTVDVAALDRLRPVVMEARRAFELLPLTLTPSDLKHSVDVFPVKFQTMKWHHRRLVGEDLLSELEIDREHLRLRAEQEIKNLLLRLRRFYIERSHRGELLEVTIARGVESLLRDLAVLIYLRTGDVLDAEATVAQAADDLGLSRQALEDARALEEGAEPEDLRALYSAFLSTVEQAATLVDAHREEGS